MAQIETMKEDDAIWVKKTSEDLGSTLAAEPVPKKRKASYWPGWKVNQQGTWQGFEIVNVGGGLEWLQASIGSEFWTYHEGKHFHMKVKKGMQPSAWEVALDMDVPYKVIEADFPDYEVVQPFMVSRAFTHS